jgi:hypothetical protein
VSIVITLLITVAAAAAILYPLVRAPVHGARRAPVQAAPPVSDRDIERAVRNFRRAPGGAGTPSLLCPACGQTYRPGDLFCTSCGHGLPQPQEPAIVQQDPVPPCASCGAPLGPADQFCAKCGQPVTAQEVG